MNNCSDEIKQIVKDLTLIIEKEIAAFEALWDVFYKQKSSVLENIEQHYIKRLKEQKEMLDILVKKFGSGQKEIKKRIELSIKFIDQCLEKLIQKQQRDSTSTSVGESSFFFSYKVGQVPLDLTHTSPFLEQR